MYRQTRIFAPLAAPFDTSLWAETVLGAIIAPAIPQTQNLEWFWFSRYVCTALADAGDCDIHGIPQGFLDHQNQFFRSIRFRYSITEEARQAFEDRIQSQIANHGCWISDFRDYPFLEDLGGDRHIGGERTDVRRQRRAQLVAKLYQAISELVIDALVGPDEQGRYRAEHNDNSQNPLGSSFESLHHLFCNITDVPTRVLISQMGVGTDWSGIQNIMQKVRVKF